MQMFSQRLVNPTRHFQNLCAPYNARSLHNFPYAIRPSELNHLAKPKRTPVSQFQTRSASPATFRLDVTRLRPRIWVSKGLGVGASAAGLGLGFAAFQLQRPAVLCDSPETSPANAPRHSEPTPPPTPVQPDDNALPPPPHSSVNVYELGFGTVAGICAGVFIKKGAKAIAFALGGVFVLLQYLASVRIIRINWMNAESSFEDTFYSRSTDEAGKEVRHPLTVYSLFRWIVDFLTADFQPRATFIAGLALGLRLG